MAKPIRHRGKWRIRPVGPDLKEADKAMFDKVAECIAKAGDLIELGVCNKKKK
jgi:hypothetical protein